MPLDRRYSDGHIDPAVTVGLAMDSGERSERSRVPLRTGPQTTGAVIGPVTGAVQVWVAYDARSADPGTETPATIALLPPVLAFGATKALGGPTGYAVNPARDLGPRTAHATAADLQHGRTGPGLLLDPGRRAAHRGRRSDGICKPAF